MNKRVIKIVELGAFLWEIRLPNHRIWFPRASQALKAVKADDKRCGNVVSTIKWKTKTKVGKHIVQILTEGS